MDFILEIAANPWGQYLLTGLSGSGFIAHAVALTPTKKDDKALGIVGGLFNLLAGNYGSARNK